MKSALWLGRYLVAPLALPALSTILVIPLVLALVTPSVPGQVTVSTPNPVTFVERLEDQNTPTNGFNLTPNWNSWTFTGYSGISDNGSAITGASQPAIEGHCTAFLQGTATISKPIQFSAGYARIRFCSALRRAGAAPDLQGIRVDVNGVRVFEEDLRCTNYDEYVTRPITIASTGTQLVTFTGTDQQFGTETALLDNISVEQLWDWDNNSIWSPHAPAAGDAVTIPAGVSVVAGAAATVRTLSIEGQLLAPMRAVSTLSAQWITVMGAGAALELGTACCPFEQKFTIPLRSPLLSSSSDSYEYFENADTFGTKAIMAMNGGRIDLLGAPKVSWVKLDGSVSANEQNSFTVTPAVDWQHGDEIVLAPSLRFAQSDKIKVAAVTPNGEWLADQDRFLDPVPVRTRRRPAHPVRDELLNIRPQ